MLFEIILIVIGIGLVIAGYAIPAKKDVDEAGAISREEVENMVSEEVESAKGRIDDIVDETINYAIEKTERSMDRLSNEKMMAVSEYSDTVLDQINKSHEEVVFLYDMLNDKHENLKETVAEAERTASSVRDTIKEAEASKTEITSLKNAAYEEHKKLQAAASHAGATQASASHAGDSQASASQAADLQASALHAGDSQSESSQEVRKPARTRKKGADTANDEAKNGDNGSDFEGLNPTFIRNVKDVDEPRKRNKPVPVIKNETLFSPMIGEEDDSEDFHDDYYEEEWENLDDSDMMDGPELSFNVHSPGSRNSNDRILELHKAGKSNMAIAKELGLGIGEVKLVIDLFKG